MGISLSGRLLRVNLPQAPEKGNVPRLPPSLAGQRVKDLLASIGNIWERSVSCLIIKKKTSDFPTPKAKCHILSQWDLTVSVIKNHLKI